MAASCAFCGEELRPNSMFCVACGQLAASGRPVDADAAVPSIIEVAPVARPVALGSPGGAAEPEVAVADRPSAPSAPVPVPPVSTGPVLHFATGQSLRIDAPVLVGRRPTATAREEGVSAFECQDPAKSVSRVHALVEVADGTLIVTDRHSGNGTRVIRDGAEILCRPDEPVEVHAGDAVWFGSMAALVG